MATVEEFARVREAQIQRAMRERKMTREEAERFVDVSESRMYDFDDVPPDPLPGEYDNEE
jgi:hypothetical protein